MRKLNIILFALAGMAAAGPGQVGAGMQSMSQSQDNVTVAPGTVSCNTGATPPQYHVANSYWRAYDLAAEGVLIPIDVTCIRFGVELALGGSGGQQPLVVRLYTQPSPAGFPTSVPVAPLITEMFMMPDSANLSSQIFVAGLSNTVTVQPSETLIVELHLPNGVPGMNVFFPGSNANGETAPTYISAPGCGFGLPTPMTALGLANPVHVILDVLYLPAGGFLQPTLTINIINQDPMTGLTEFTLTNGNLTPGHEIWNFYSFNPCTNGPFFGLCFTNLAVELYPQFNTPLGFEPLRYLATGCSKTMGPYFLPTGPSIAILPVDFDGVNGVFYSAGAALNQVF